MYFEVTYLDIATYRYLSYIMQVSENYMSQDALESMWLALFLAAEAGEI